MADLLSENRCGIIGRNESYFCSGRGLILPVFDESTWSVGLRAVLYLVAMLWCFLGISIIMDMFMCAIENISSVTIVSKPEGSFPGVKKKVWNDTMANLTLMALGSSMPEILLSFYELLIRNKMCFGKLGPATIVGSAAFNLFVITGVCIICVPTPDCKGLRARRVFFVTAFFSVFAYIWMLIILMFISPNVVEVWEAAVTLLFFPIFLILAYLADKKCCRKGKVDDSLYPKGEDDSNQMSRKRMKKIIKDLKRISPHLSEEDIVKIATARLQDDIPRDRMWYRIHASRILGGGRRLKPALNKNLENVLKLLKINDKNKYKKDEEDAENTYENVDRSTSEEEIKSVIEFIATQSAVIESAGKVKVGIRRYGKLSNECAFRVETFDGTATANTDYVPVQQDMIFKANEDTKSIEITIIDDNICEPDETFYLKLVLPETEKVDNDIVIGRRPIHEIWIINDDVPGTFQFAKPCTLVRESENSCHLEIERIGANDGRITLRYRSQDITAKAGRDYRGGYEQQVIFEHRESNKNIEIPILDRKDADNVRNFRVELLGVDGGATLGSRKQAVASIVKDEEFDKDAKRLTEMTNDMANSLQVQKTTWGQQFRNALSVNGGDSEKATTSDHVLHALAFAWKLVFAFCPPPSLLWGWPCFFVALCMIGGLTAIIGDLASIFGCLIGLKESVIAITFVALGSSIPDLFASKIAACNDDHADNAIGNVTGSNSVNVFLGVGLPWLIAAIYWNSKGLVFHADAGDIGFSVACYAVGAVICILVLMVRRSLTSAELGGHLGPKVVTGLFVIFLWVPYVVLSALQAYGYFPYNWA